MLATVTEQIQRNDDEGTYRGEASRRRTSRLAIAGLALGLLSYGLWLFTGMPAPFVAALAFLCGVGGRRAIYRSQGRLAGYRFASAGLWIAVVYLVLWLQYWVTNGMLGV